MAREAAGDDWGLFQEYMPEIHRRVELVRADERARMAEQPAQRTWVGLTDEDKEELQDSWVSDQSDKPICYWPDDFIEAIEAKLKAKNLP